MELVFGFDVGSSKHGHGSGTKNEGQARKEGHEASTDSRAAGDEGKHESEKDKKMTAIRKP